jgi:ankyrin repeat protein
MTLIGPPRFFSMLALLVLLVSCASPGDKGTSALFQAVEVGDVGRVRTLLQEGADPDDRIRYSLFVQVNLHEGSHYWDPENGTTALMIASQKGSVPMVTALLGAGANPNRETRIGKTALMFAAEHCHLDVMRLLLSKNADITAVATGGTNHLGADLSGSVLRFSLRCAVSGKPDVTYFVLDRLKPGDVPDRELSYCLDLRYGWVPSNIKQRIAALGRQ